MRNLLKIKVSYLILSYLILYLFYFFNRTLIIEAYFYISLNATSRIFIVKKKPYLEIIFMFCVRIKIDCWTRTSTQK